MLATSCSLTARSIASQRLQAIVQSACNLACSFLQLFKTRLPEADDAASDVHPVECERYRRADRHRETADVDVANAKEKPRNPANVYHADSRARHVHLEFLTSCPRWPRCLASANRRGNFELITGCNSSWFASRGRISVCGHRSFLFQSSVRITMLKLISI